MPIYSFHRSDFLGREEQPFRTRYAESLIKLLSDLSPFDLFQMRPGCTDIIQSYLTCHGPTATITARTVTYTPELEILTQSVDVMGLTPSDNLLCQTELILPWEAKWLLDPMNNTDDPAAALGVLYALLDELTYLGKCPDGHHLPCMESYLTVDAARYTACPNIHASLMAQTVRALCARPADTLLATILTKHIYTLSMPVSRYIRPLSTKEKRTAIVRELLAKRSFYERRQAPALATIRERRRIDTKRLARKAGIPTPDLIEYETYADALDRAPTQRISALSNALHVHPAYLRFPYYGTPTTFDPTPAHITDTFAR